MAEYVTRAFSLAMAGRPGPVVLALPRDMLAQPADCRDMPFVAAPETYPGAAEMAALEELLAKAKRPMLLVGGSRWNEESPLSARPLCPAFRFTGGQQLSPRAFVRPDRAQLCR